MSAEVEEVVIDPDAVHAEDLGEEPAQDLLPRSARPARGGRGGQLRRRKGLAVHLAVRVERERAELDEGRRDHVRGQRLCRPLPQTGHVQPLVPVDRNDVGDDPLVTGPVLTDDDHALGHPRVRDDHGLDLAEFDAVAADLDLEVDPAQVVQLPVRTPLREVARAVHALTRSTERARHEAPGGQSGLVEVPPAQSVAGDVELPRRTHRDRAQRGVQDMHVHIADRAADRCGTLAGDVREGGPDGRFRRAVEVGDARGELGHPARQRGRHGFRADEDPQTAQGVGVLGDQALPEGGGRLHDGHAGRGEQAGQLGGVADLLGGGDDHRRA